MTLAMVWRNFPVKSGHRVLNMLLLAVPVAIALHYLAHVSAMVMFIASGIAIIPLAGVLGEATEDLSEHVGPGLGGLLNATMGNATELIIAALALYKGHTEIVKASLSGSIIGNILLVLGAACVAGGIGKQHQKFSRQTASVNATLLFIAVVALVMPAVYDLAVFGHLEHGGRAVEQLSLWTSVVLVVIYVLSLVFTFVTHRAVPARTHDPKRKPARSAKAALISLIVATILVGLLSEMLVEQLEPVKRLLGWTDLFMGVVIIALIGNAAEHASAILFAMRDDMELALSIAIGSSVQIAVFVAPVLVFLSWAFGHPMSLVFSAFEIAAIGLSVMIVEMISSDGETTWLEGAQLLAVYLILAIAFYLVPVGQGRAPQ